MNKHILCLVVLLSFFITETFAQKQLQITYENTTFGFSNVRSSKVKVVSTNEVCLSVTEDLWNETIIVGEGRNRRSEFGPVTKIKSYSYFKNYLDNMMYYFDKKIFPCYIKEELNQFNWEIVEEQKEVLGYKCTKAITYYRGRDYIAWFTTELPFKAAPWKYHGLPGVVLEVKSMDDFTSMIAIELKITKGNKPENPFKQKKFISWKEFTELYKEKLLVGYEKFKANNVKCGVSYSGPNRPRVEIILPCNKLTNNRNKYWKRRLLEKEATKSQ